ncbi:hypothetical protein SAMN05660909_02732 [Chitinophaga terrae (ex Kim and Jung 2007)]|uniref:Uncharacterized protein n=1 Tax=Chitinophaga terrae (ex Kim and Jung 2007) TaxID=408074 RepID=A0A1H4CR04_9BACT|nr:hypothetical protein [Chitinophaga terrae (ex Kim and Jung 2007)]GEP90399.1 hypothetical protein CTE07_20440 [Chitinophaga terrae (ex Kim and Jung 2007)]SEA62777.1 hypothetical protein SAMN05660909_02732 [Chitinophaga terrae (ex Kim and Jung 2007)]
MKLVYLSLSVAFLSLSAYAQKTSIKWGDEFNLRKGSTDLRVISVEKNAAYLQESHPALKSYFVVGATMRESASLVKIDKDLKEVYRNDFNKELRGKEFVQFLPFEDKLYLFSSDYSKRDRTLEIYASAIDKNTGELTGEFRQVASFLKEEKKDDIDFKITYNADSSRVLIVSSVKGAEKNIYKVQELGKNLRAAGRPVTLTNEFEEDKYQLEDLLYTSDRKIILVGRMYEYEEGKKQKKKFLDFTNYNIRIYNDKGKQQSELNTTINGKWLISTKLVQEKNKDLVLAAFYSNQKKGKTIDGLLVQRINTADGTAISTSDKPINNSLLNGMDDDNNEDVDDKEDSKEERKMRESLAKLKDEGEGFSKYMQFRNIFYTEDKGLVIFAEHFHHYITTSQSYTSGVNGMPGTWSTTTYSNYISGDLLMCKIDASGNINWLQILPKMQREVIRYGSYRTPGYGFSMHMSYFAEGNRPFYSGFGAIQSGNTIHILFNDNTKNSGIVQAGQKAKSTVRFSKTDCYVLDLDENTGKLSRKTFFSNKDVPTAMPRLGAVIGNDMYMVGKSDRMIGKSKIAVAKISME